MIMGHLWSVLVKCRVSEIGLFFSWYAVSRCSKTGSEHLKEYLPHGELEKMALTTVDLLGLECCCSMPPETRANFSKSKFWPAMGQVEV